MLEVQSVVPAAFLSPIIRYSYRFTTENGLGYEAFNAIVPTIAQKGDKLWPELKALTGKRQIASPAIPHQQPEGCATPNQSRPL